MVEIIQALECIGCGRLEGPRPCIGVCQDRIVDLVCAADYREAAERAKAMEAIIRQLAWTTPRHGEWEHSYRMLQRRAREALGQKPPGGTAEPVSAAG